MLIIAATISTVVRLIVHATLASELLLSTKTLLTVWRVLVHVCGVVWAVVVRMSVVACISALLMLRVRRV